MRAVITLAMLLAGVDGAAAAPTQLKGKSITLRWAENRVQRSEGDAEFRSVVIPIQLSLYVSTAGRVFNTMRSSSGANQQAPGEADRGGRVPSFSGQRMTIIQPLRALARRIVVDFDPTFASCVVTVTVAKQSGAQVGYIRTFSTGIRREIRSVSVSGSACSVQSGNVFQ